MSRTSNEIKTALATLPISIPLGIGISYLVLSLIMFSFQDAFALIALSIICTLGIGLIIWVPIWFVVGYGVLLALRFGLVLFGKGDVVDAFWRKRRKPREQTAAPDDEITLTDTALSRDQVALTDYIKRARKKGHTRPEITQSLVQAGWQPPAIAEAFDLVDGASDEEA